MLLQSSVDQAGSASLNMHEQKMQFETISFIWNNRAIMHSKTRNVHYASKHAWGCFRHHRFSQSWMCESWTSKQIWLPVSAGARMCTNEHPPPEHMTFRSCFHMLGWATVSLVAKQESRDLRVLYGSRDLFSSRALRRALCKCTLTTLSSFLNKPFPVPVFQVPLTDRTKQLPSLSNTWHISWHNIP